MKKFIFAALMGMASVCASAQNIQIHYDFGKHINDDLKSRQDVTLTYETFKADNLGSWFYFIDADMDKNGVAGAYTEISREFNIGKQGFAAHVELDAGMNRITSFQSAALIGAAWNGHNADYSTTYSIQAMYKQYFGQDSENMVGANKAYPSFQITGVWSTRFANDKLTFSGFIDFWRDVTMCGTGKLVIFSEPQLWYNINKSISVGTEVEITNKFYSDSKTYVNPTLAVKFNL